MKIVNFDSFLEFADDLGVKYRFYRIIENKLQAFMIGGKGLVIYSEIENPSQEQILKLANLGFIETKLSKEEVKEFGLE